MAGKLGAWLIAIGVSWCLAVTATPADARKRKRARPPATMSVPKPAPVPAAATPVGAAASPVTPAAKPAPIATKPATAAAASAVNGALIRAYKRDPLPVYDDAGERIGELTKGELPTPGSPGARVIRAKPGYVAIMVHGALTWLRLSTVDYVGDVKATRCDAMAVQFAKMEEDALGQGLGLGCAK